MKSNYFKDLFHRILSFKHRLLQKKVSPTLKYKSLSEVSSKKKLNDIPELEFNNIDKPPKKRLVVMDDNETGVMISMNDLSELGNLSKSLRDYGIAKLPKKYTKFVQGMTNDELLSLHKFCLDDYEVIESTTDMAAFSVVELNKKIDIDYAFLDILVGGLQYYNGKLRVIDGIDVAFEIIKRNPNAKILFYSGCNINEESSEYKKAKRLLNIDIRDYLALKDSDLMKKRKRLIKFLGDKK